MRLDEHPRQVELRRLLDRLSHAGGRVMIVDSLNGVFGSAIRAEYRVFLAELQAGGWITGYEEDMDPASIEAGAIKVVAAP